MDLGLEGRIAIVNGASQGIGHAIARTLAEEGARVVATARWAPALAEAVRGLGDETGGEVVAAQSEEAMSELARDIPLGHVGRPEDVAFRVSPRGRYVTGATIPVDGGLHKALL